MKKRRRKKIEDRSKHRMKILWPALLHRVAIKNNDNGNNQRDIRASDGV